MKKKEEVTVLLEGGCKQKIMGRKHLLTNTEMKVATYVLDHYEEILNYNITELAENAGVSDASVVRFCKNIGYKGYQEFKVNAAKDVLPSVKHFNPQLEQNDDPKTICRKIFTSEEKVLERTLAGLDIDMMMQVADCIRKAKKIIFFGSGGSLLVGMDAQHKFMKIGIQVHVYEDKDLQLMSSSLMKEGDLAFGISHSGSNNHVLNCLKNAKENGAMTVALVSQGKSPMSKVAGMALYSAAEKTIFKSESVSTRIAQLAIIDSLVAIVAFADYDDSYEAIQKTRQATSDGKL